MSSHATDDSRSLYFHIVLLILQKKKKPCKTKVQRML